MIAQLIIAIYGLTLYYPLTNSVFNVSKVINVSNEGRLGGIQSSTYSQSRRLDTFRHNLKSTRGVPKTSLSDHQQPHGLKAMNTFHKYHRNNTRYRHKMIYKYGQHLVETRKNGVLVSLQPFIHLLDSRHRRRRRFFSNLRTKLKGHLKKAEQAWKLSSKEALDLFEKYYDCQMAKMKESSEFPIQTLMAIEGETIVLTCRVCYRPDVAQMSQRAVWQVLKHEDTALEVIVPGDRHEVKVDNSLTINSVDVNDAGQYFCVDDRDYAAVYQLDVFLTDHRKHIKPGHDFPQEDVYLINRNLHVFTMWATWSDCNTCDRPGQRTRVGQCTVKKIYADVPIFPRDYGMMMFYKEGVPCHSTALPRHLRQIPEISMRYSETMVLECNEKCPTDPPPLEITDNSGKVIEVIEPGFHPINSKPALPPLVKRKVLYEPQDSHLVLHCPGELNIKLIHWARGERQIDPGSIKHQTNGRVSVDSLNKLHIKKLLLSDTAVYKNFLPSL